MITFSDISFSYDEREELSLQQIAGEVKSGECIVVTGKSGCGKTTLSRFVNGLIPELYEGKLQGNCQVADYQNPGTPIYQLSEQVGSVFQNPKTQFFTTDVLSELAFACENLGMERTKMEQRIAEVAAMFQIEHLLERDMFSLSGGEKQLIAIASAYMPNPRILVLDEPSSNLDFSTIEHLQVILTKLKQNGITLLIVEHRLYYLQSLADKFWVIEEGRLQQSYTATELQNLTVPERLRLGLRSVRLESEIAQIPEQSRQAETNMKQLTIHDLLVCYPRAKKKQQWMLNS